MKRQPIVVVVGRPNVGKSTLFNRLTGSRRATIVDTGGLLLEDEDRFIPLIRGQAEVAIRNADAVVFLLDGDVGPIPEDLDIADYLRGLGVPVVPVVNKGDRKGVELQSHEFHNLGLGEPVVISAEHGTGIGYLWEALAPHLPTDEDEEDLDERERSDEIHVAVIGRPNVGKSSLINRLVGDERVLVTEVPGTTRDAVDVIFERDGVRYRFVDTAGIRRKGRTDRGPEVLSVVMARRHLERADLCLLLVDADEGITRQDAHVGGYAWEAGRAVVLVVNKWDLVADRTVGRRRIEDQVGQHLKFMRHAPQVFLSALNGKGVHRLFPAMRDLHRFHFLRVTASELNRVVRDAWDQNPPPMAGKTGPKLYYCSQVHRAPPHFVFFTITGLRRSCRSITRWLRIRMEARLYGSVRQSVAIV